MRKQYQAVTAEEAVKVIKSGDLGETSKLYRERYIKCNVAMIQVCPRDKFGYVSLGSSVDATLAAMESAEFVIAVAHPQFQEQLDEAAFKRFGSHFHYLWSHV